MIKKLSEFVKRGGDPVIFYTNLSSPMLDIPFAIMNIYNITHYYNGPCVATDLETAKILTKTNNRLDRYFYVYDLEWLRKPIPYEAALEVMRNDDLKLIARSNSHKKLIENYCNKEVVGIVDDFSCDDFEKVFNK